MTILTAFNNLTSEFESHSQSPVLNSLSSDSSSDSSYDSSSDCSVKRNKQLFSKQDWCLLNHLWSLDNRYFRLLDEQQVYQTTIADFLASTRPAATAHTFIDRLIFDGKGYAINYIYCSRVWMIDYYNNKAGSTKLLFKLRVNKANNFYCCLVRPVNDSMVITTDKYRLFSPSPLLKETTKL